MKFTIEGFSQEVAVKLGLDAVDLVLLRWLVDFYNTGVMEMHIFGDKHFFWVHYETILTEMPILWITNKVSLGRRFKRMVKSGLMEFRVFEGAGNRTYYRFDENLLTGLLSNKTKGGIDSNIKGVSTFKSRGSLLKSKDIDSSIRDSSIINSNIIAWFDYFCLKTKKNLKLTQDRSRIIKKRFDEGYSLDQLKQAVDSFVQDDWPERYKYIDVIYCIGQQRGKPDALDKWLFHPKGNQPKSVQTSTQISETFLNERLGRIATKDMIKVVMREIPQGLWWKINDFIRKRYTGSNGSVFAEAERELLAEIKSNREQFSALAGTLAGSKAVGK